MRIFGFAAWQLHEACVSGVFSLQCVGLKEGGLGFREVHEMLKQRARACDT